MVLINNKNGDIKTGAQGEAVYQGRYGRQIRRVRSEKRGEVSKVQKARRLLFRQALEWRAGLNRHDRLVLEQAAYYFHYTDSEGIILTWDRMALKIALEVPTVEVIE
jgi:hypothetical protein